MDGTNSTTAWTIAGIVALAVIIAGGWLISRENGSKGSMASSTEKMLEAVKETSDAVKDTSASAVTAAGTAATAAMDAVKSTPTVIAGGETITVNDQPAGVMVKVEGVKLSKPSWVAIVGTNKWVRGAAWFNESRENVEVELLKPTVAGETYQAVIYVDDGDKKFELHDGDTLVTSTDGAPVSSTFKAQ